MTPPPRKPSPPAGPLVVFLPGLGAVATTFVAGVEAVRRGVEVQGRKAEPVGSLSQLQTIRLGKRSENRMPRIKDFLPLASLDDLVFSAWDPIPDDAFVAARRAGVLDEALLAELRPFLESIRPHPAAFDRAYVKNLDGPNVKKAKTKLELAEAIREDIRNELARHGATRGVMIWCGSTEAHLTLAGCHRDPDLFEEGLKRNDPAISPSQLYAYAAIREGIPYANGAPNLGADVPALSILAQDEANGVPIAGKDFKTGQTFLKTALAPALKSRMLGVSGWFSTNILGNRDGEVLDDPASFKAKEETKSGVLAGILQPDLYPNLYGALYHKVRINYYPPRGDAKEGWDNVDLFGWLGYPMQLKIDFLCRDSILAAPIVLDLVLFLDLAARSGYRGVQEWLSFYFKCPQVAPNHVPEHDLFIQHFRLKNTLRVLGGEAPLTHLSEDFEGP